jgi:hypothetical protein
MYSKACDYAQALGLHNMDGEDGAKKFIRPGMSDEDRRGFWDLIQCDTMFRLIFNKPPSISGRVWKVNFPWLEPSSAGAPETDDATAFLVRSRVTLIQIRFFAMLEETAAYDSELLHKTEDLCSEVLELYESWDVVRDLTDGSLGYRTLTDHP